MQLTKGFQLLEIATQQGLILPAFNTTNLEMTYAIAQGLDSAGIPGYIQISSNNLKLSNPKIIGEMARDAVRNASTPIGLHLDHGKSLEDVMACVTAGFTSIMIDASSQSFEDNIRIVKEVVDYCHSREIPVEAELGAISGKEDSDHDESESKTNPGLVKEFVERSGCDLLAVSVGNVHGLGTIPNIDLPLLKMISECSPVPLVLHGGSGIPWEIIWEAKRCNLRKINYGSDLRKEYIRTFGIAYERDHNEHDLFKLCRLAIENVSLKAKELAERINQK